MLQKYTVQILWIDLTALHLFYNAMFVPVNKHHQIPGNPALSSNEVV